MDEVPLSFDIPPTRTVDVQGASSIPINTTGNERTSFTVVLCCAANGGHPKMSLRSTGRSRSTHRTTTAGSDIVQSGRPIFDDFFQHLWPYIGNNTANVVFQMVKRLWLIRIDQ
ncbi:hypothetical protein TNCV_346101 [Trichonephila clavipes]|nr:hypothetical protein TNCV_346101 [Trichonephila clavipes]